MPEFQLLISSESHRSGLLLSIVNGEAIGAEPAVSAFAGGLSRGESDGRAMGCTRQLSTRTLHNLCAAGCSRIGKLTMSEFT